MQLMGRILGHRRFKADLIPSLFALALVTVFGMLSSWQFSRAQEKRDLYAQFESGSGETALGSVPLVRGDDHSVIPGNKPGADNPRYRLATVQGHYDGDRQILIDQMTHRGRIGYQVLTPFVPADGSPLVIVNRGWIPAPPTRDQMPDINVHNNERSVTGRLDTLPRPRLRLNQDLPADAPWPRRMVFPDMRMLGNALDTDLAAYAILLNGDAADGFIRDWTPRVMGPSKHLAYALQWLGLAAAVLIIYILLGFTHGARQKA